MGKQKKTLTSVFASNLRAERVRRGWTQEFLAEKSDSSQTYLSAVERAVQSPSLHFVDRVCSALGVSPALLMNDLIQSR